MCPTQEGTVPDERHDPPVGGHGGHVVNISSTGALQPDNGVYGSTKATANYLNRALRTELEEG